MAMIFFHRGPETLVILLTGSPQCPWMDGQIHSIGQPILTELSQSNTKSPNSKVGKRLTVLILISYQYSQAEGFQDS